MTDNVREIKRFVERRELQEQIERERNTLNELVMKEYNENAVLTSSRLLEQSHAIDKLVLEQLRRNTLERR